MTRNYKQWITQVGCILYLEMWTDMTMDNLLIKTHSTWKQKSQQSCKQGYNTPAHQSIFKTPVQNGEKHKNWKSGEIQIGKKWKN